MRQTAFSLLLLLLSTLQPVMRAQETGVERSFNLNRPEREEWLRDQGFGLFIHWSLDSQLGIVISHSLPGASEDYCQRFFYELPKSFDPKRFNPKEWARLAKLMGVKYIVFTTKHHSGFCMWHTKTTDFSIRNTPYKKDILKEFVAALRAEGLAVGFYFSPDDFKFLYDNNIPINRYAPTHPVFPDGFMPKYEAFLEAQTRELFSRYGKIDVLFIDGEPKDPVKYTAWKLQPDVVITRGAVNTPEQHILGQAENVLWESCITMGNQWQYKPTNDELKSGTHLIEMLIETRAKGGNLLLNVGPHPDGYIPEAQEVRMREVAAWMFINGESIYGVRPWRVAREDNLWFSCSKDKKTVYVYVTKERNWAKGARKEFLIKSVRATANTRASVLGQNSMVLEYSDNVPETTFEQTADGLKVSCVRAQRIYNNTAWPNPIVIKLENVE